MATLFSAAQISAALHHFLQIPGQPRTDRELIAWLIATYNERHPDYPLAQPKTSGSRRYCDRMVTSDKLDHALSSDPTGAAFLASLLPDLRNSVRVMSLPLSGEFSAEQLTTTLQMAANVHAQIQSILASHGYLQFSTMTQAMYNTACQFKPGFPDELSLQSMQEAYPDTAAAVNKFFNRLNILQTGSTTAPYAPLSGALNDWILRCEQEESLLDIAKQAQYGFTLCAVILQDNPAASYFALVAKAPDRIVYIRDINKTPYPGQVRRTDRDQNDRMNASPFPYSLIDLSASPDGRRLRLNQDSTTITPSSPLPVLASVGDMEASELVELLTLTHLITADWIALQPATLAQPAQALLSFTPDVSPSALPALAQSTPIDLPWAELTVHKLTSERYAQAELENGYPPPERNWVAEQLLPEVSPFLQERPLLSAEGTSLTAINVDGRPALLTTEQGVRSDLYFLARSSQACAIQDAIKLWKPRALADARTWMTKQQTLRDSLRLLLLEPALLMEKSQSWNHAEPTPEHLEIFKQHLSIFGFSDELPNKSDPVDVAEEKFRKASRNHYTYSLTPWFCDSDLIKSGTYPSEHKVSLNKGRRYDYQMNGLDHLPSHGLVCPFDNQPAQVFVDVTFKGYGAITALTGVDWHMLPPYLRVLGIKCYFGNSILDRLDPVLHLHNWEQTHDFTVSLGVSVTTLNQWRKEANLPKLSKTALKQMLKRVI